MNRHMGENPDSRMSQAPKEENISKREVIFIHIKYCRLARRKMVESQLLGLAVKKP